MRAAGNKTISFVIPTYNAASHLECCLQSIKKQHYPEDKIEILIIDGGSTDTTLGLARKYGASILHNPKRLAEYGVQLGVEQASGELLVVFAADNELVGDTWIQQVVAIFDNEPEIIALWGRLASGKNDPALNKYFELIQSDPLNWFINRNLQDYITQSAINEDCYVFTVSLRKPLVWGANGLVYKTERIKKIWAQEGYLGDNDAFQCLVEEGNVKVAYIAKPFVYHHHVARLADWIKKWQRNFFFHLVDKQKTRNMNWLYAKNFKIKLFFWICYSMILPFSLVHSIYLSIRFRNIYWYYHPIVSFLQCMTYSILIIFTKKGRDFLRNTLLPL